MKKIITTVIITALLFSLGGCSRLEALKAVELPPLPDPNAAADGAGPVPEAEVSPDAAAQEPDYILGNRVLVSIRDNTEIHYAPDNENQRILIFSYDDAIVHIEGNDEASASINDSLALVNEIYYSGTEVGGGMNSMLELALDNYGYAKSSGKELSLEFSSVRDISIPRADDVLLSVLMHTHVFTGGEKSENFDRAYVYDTVSGQQLSLDAVVNDKAQLVEYLQAEILKQIDNQDIQLTVEDKPSAVSALIRDGSWYFDRDALVIFSDPGEIADAELGSLSFTFPLEEIKDLFNRSFAPLLRGGEGDISVSTAAEGIEIIDRVDVDADGTEFFLVAEGTVYDVSIGTVEYSGKFYPTGTNWFCSYIDGSAVQLITVIPEGMPKLRICYTDAAGNAYDKLLTESGIDGRIILLDMSSISTLG